MKWIIFLFPIVILSQGIGHYNQFPTMHYDTDIETTDISFAYSFRLLRPEYTGPVVQLRRSSDNATQDFYVKPGDFITENNVTAWAGIDDVFITIWYDQSGLGRDAVQPTEDMQPILKFHNNKTPYFQGDGSNDLLVVPYVFSDLSQDNKVGTILGVFAATKRGQNSFGVKNNNNTSDRWSTHINWSNNFVYFDPGICCYSIRSYDNSDGESILLQYTFRATPSDMLIRRNMSLKKTGPLLDYSYGGNSYFGIGATIGDIEYEGRGNATTWFTEMIMYNNGISSERYTKIEKDQISFWGL